MKSFLKRHSVDLTRRNSKGEDNDNEVKLDIKDIKDLKITDTTTDPCEGLTFKVGVSENKNSKYRRSMEDVHTYVSNFCDRLDWGYFAIFDGHAGKQTSRWCGSNLHNLLFESIINDKFGDLRDNLNKSFQKADELIGDEEGIGNSGCTAAVAVLRWEEEIEGEGEGEGEVIEENTDNDHIDYNKHKRILYTANVGDSRIILNRNGKAIRLSYEHKGNDLNERRRIEENGGIIIGNRVNGILAVTRSLGDKYVKEFVIGKPFTTMIEIIPDMDKEIIIGCDGLWDVCEDDKAIELIKGIKDVNDASKVLVDYAISNGTTDNVTVMVIRLGKD